MFNSCSLVISEQPCAPEYKRSLLAYGARPGTPHHRGGPETAQALWGVSKQPTGNVFTIFRLEFLQCIITPVTNKSLSTSRRFFISSTWNFYSEDVSVNT